MAQGVIEVSILAMSVCDFLFYFSPIVFVCGLFFPIKLQSRKTSQVG